MTKEIKLLILSILGCFSYYIGVNAGQLIDNNIITTIIIGLVIVFISFILYRMKNVRDERHFFIIILNYFSTGLIVSGFLIHQEIEFTHTALLLSMFLSFLYFILYILFNQIVYVKHFAFVGVFILIPVIITSIFCFTDVIDFPVLLLFTMFISYFGIVSYRISEESNVLEKSALISFGLYFLTLFCILVVLSEGEALDISGIGGSKNKQKGNL